MIDSDDKYITFKRDELFKLIGMSDAIHNQLLSMSLKDAVVIRRQDYFASPALATYSSCIAMVAMATKKPDLMKIADYFQRQSELAADEGWKFPDV